ncbi:hypothetical protein NM688_g5703 [Phlebia brevispora]|uniref:Uncharacterized protein n=1 Tax=Phlebia brevispora TaxID=194682 RepID=A0ACC1SR81_9APHY|nr:hypothetical protein NM688_g5703 [Phlebia brevispora]
MAYVRYKPIGPDVPDVPFGTVSVGRFSQTLRLELVLVSRRDSSNWTFTSLVSAIQETKAAFGILSDELTTMVLDFRYHQTLRTALPAFSIVPVSEVELPLVIAFCIHIEAAAWRLTTLFGDSPTWRVRGALNSPEVLDALNTDISQHKDKKWFSDFNLYAMQRQPELWYQFSSWRAYVQDEGLKRPIMPGTTVALEPGGFARRQGLIRSPFAYHQFPQDTIDSIFGRRARRPREAVLDKILTSLEAITVTITQPVRTGAEHFSQVFFGQVSGCDEVVCIELYDVRYFPIPDEDDIECVMGPPHIRLGGLNYSEDLGRREESVYDSLSDLQEGLSLRDVHSSKPADTLQAELVTQARHGVRALRAAGVTQPEWHPGQILCPSDAQSVHVIFIDFAFCEMYLGEDKGFPPTEDLDEVYFMFISALEFDEPRVKKCWLQPLKFEYYLLGLVLTDSPGAQQWVSYLKVSCPMTSTRSLNGQAK